MPASKLDTDGPSTTGTVGRRAEQGADEAFRFDLFCASRPPGEDFAFLDGPMRDTLLRQQFAGQTATYRARYPDARFEIVTWDEAPIGRIVTDRTNEALTLVDLALLPAWRGRGIGTGLLMAAFEQARAARVPVRLCASASNAGALRLYRRLGFRAIDSSEVQVAMVWRADRAGSGAP